MGSNVKRSLTLQCLGGLTLGVLAGAALAQFQAPSVESWRKAADTTIQLWTNALRLVVTPLVVAQLFASISAEAGPKGEGRKLGLLIPSVFAGLLIFTALLAMATMAGLLSLTIVGGLSPGHPPAAPSVAAEAADAAAQGSWVDQLVPPNLFAAASSSSILGVMLFTVAFALAARRINPGLKHSLDQGARGVRDALFVLVDWLIRFAPLALFGLGLRAASSSGLAIGRVLVVYTILSLIVFVVCTLALYPLIALLGGVGLGRLARALFPAQATAAATRSSLATLPSLLQESERILQLPEKVSATVIPLAGAMLKLSRAASNPMKLLFLAWLLGVPLGVKGVVVFVLLALLLSTTTPGIPRVMSASRTLPLYVSLGIAPEYVILLGATTAITDVIQTVLNSTGYMGANVLVARLLATKRRTTAEPQVPASEIFVPGPVVSAGLEAGGGGGAGGAYRP